MTTKHKQPDDSVKITFNLKPASTKAKLEKEAKKARRTLTDHLNYLIETHPERGR